MTVVVAVADDDDAGVVGFYEGELQVVVVIVVLLCLECLDLSVEECFVGLSVCVEVYFVGLTVCVEVCFAWLPVCRVLGSNKLFGLNGGPLLPDEIDLKE